MDESTLKVMMRQGFQWRRRWWLWCCLLATLHDGGGSSQGDSSRRDEMWLWQHHHCVALLGCGGLMKCFRWNSVPVINGQENSRSALWEYEREREKKREWGPVCVWDVWRKEFIRFPSLHGHTNYTKWNCPLSINLVDVLLALCVGNLSTVHEMEP